MYNERMKEGVDIAKESFLMLWQHPYLVIYMALASLASVLIGFFTLSVPAPYWLKVLPLIFIRQCFIIYFTARLVHHAMHIIHHNEEKVSNELTIAMPNSLYIFAWAAITTAIHVLWSLVFITSLSHVFIYSVATALLIAWSFFTLLVIPIMTTEKINFWHMIRLSMHLVKNDWVEILSGQAIILAGFLPVWLLSYWCVSFLALLITWPLESIIYTVQGLFITLIYYYFYKRPLEEIDILRFPEM